MSAVSCGQRWHAGSKTLHQQNPPVHNWTCQRMQADLYNGRKMVVALLLAAMSSYSQETV